MIWRLKGDETANKPVPEITEIKLHWTTLKALTTCLALGDIEGSKEENRPPSSECHDCTELVAFSSLRVNGGYPSSLPVQSC